MYADKTDLIVEVELEISHLNESFRRILYAIVYDACGIVCESNWALAPPHHTRNQLRADILTCYFNSKRYDAYTM